MEFSSNLLWFLAGVTARTAGLALLGLAAIVLLRMKTAAARHAVWTVVMAGMLLAAALAPVMPELPLRVLKPIAHVSAVLPPSVGQGIDLPVRAAKPAPAPPRPFSWSDAAAVLYAAGTIVFLLRLAFSYLFTRRLVRASRPVEGADFRESRWISVPLTVGWLRPRILLPAGWETWDRAKLQAVLVHERTHVRRADWAIALAAGVNRCLFWFHPLAWWLKRKLASLAEQACDDAALLETGTRETYAQALLEMAAAVQSGQGRLVWEAMAMAKAAEVRTRIERILDETRQIPRGLTRLRWAALLACGLPLIYITAVVRPMPAQPQEPPRKGAMSPVTTLRQVMNRYDVTAANVNQLEARLAGEPQNLELRAELILYYFTTGQREPRLTHLFWLIQNHPEYALAGSVSAGILPRTSDLNDAADFDRAANLWREQAALHATEPQVLANAAHFFAEAGGDVDEAERLLKQATVIQPPNPMYANQLARLYASAILANSGEPAYRSARSNPSFGARAITELETSNDPWLLRFAASDLMIAGRPPEDHPLLAQTVQLGERLLAKAQHIAPPAPAQVNAQPLVSPAPPAPLPVHRVEPVYPPLAQQARISGMVELSATAGTDGRVTDLRVVRGHPLLVQAALDAVKQWVFGPQAAATTYTVMLPFTLPDAGPVQRMAVGGSAGPATSDLQAPPPPPAPPPLSRVEPVYPALARQARISGIVSLTIVIGTDGRVSNIKVVRGHPLLVQSALDAVKQWVFGTQAAPTQYFVDVPFRLSNSATPAAAGVLGGTIQPGPAGNLPSSPPPSPTRIRIGGNVQMAKLIRHVEPEYPDAARAAGLEGTVQLQLVIAKDGNPLSVSVLEGNPVLAAAALNAVKQWVYQPTLLNGQPIEVETTVEVPFKLQ